MSVTTSETTEQQDCDISFEQKNESSYKLFVGGIEPTVTAVIMSQYFSDFGPVADANIMMDRITGRARGFGFVAMADQESYDAVLACASHSINNKPVDVKPSFENNPPLPGTVGKGPYNATKNLHISNLSSNATLELIEEYFKDYCEVKEVVVKSGFAFVNTGSIEQATNAMTKLQGSVFLGQAIVINYAKDYMQKNLNFQMRGQQGRYTGLNHFNGHMGKGGRRGGVGGSQQQPPGMMYGYGGMVPNPNMTPPQPVVSPVLQGAWLPMAQIFSEGHVMNDDGREWHYTGMDGSVQGPFPSKEMNEWRMHGFFSNDKNVSMRLAVPPPHQPHSQHSQHIYGQQVQNGVHPSLWAVNNGGGGGGGSSINGNINQVRNRGMGRSYQTPSDLSTKNKIFVGGLDPSITDEIFGKYFNTYGHVINAHVMKDRETGHSRGFGFVTFSEQNECEYTLSISNHEINGKWVELRKAELPGSRGGGKGNLINLQDQGLSLQHIQQIGNINNGVNNGGGGLNQVLNTISPLGYVQRGGMMQPQYQDPSSPSSNMNNLGMHSVVGSGDGGVDIGGSHPNHHSGGSSQNSLQQSPFKIFVGGIHSSVTNDILKRHFDPYGNSNDCVLDSRIIINPDTQHSKGYGYIIMKDEESYNHVLNPSITHELNGTVLEIRPTYAVDINQYQQCQQELA